MTINHTPGPWFLGVYKSWADSNGNYHSTIIPVSLDYHGEGYSDNPSIFAANETEIVGCDEYYVFRNKDDLKLMIHAATMYELLLQLVKEREECEHISLHEAYTRLQKTISKIEELLSVMSAQL